MSTTTKAGDAAKKISGKPNGENFSSISKPVKIQPVQKQVQVTVKKTLPPPPPPKKKTNICSERWMQILLISIGTGIVFGGIGGLVAYFLLPMNTDVEDVRMTLYFNGTDSDCTTAFVTNVSTEVATFLEVSASKVSSECGDTLNTTRRSLSQETSFPVTTTAVDVSSDIVKSKISNVTDAELLTSLQSVLTAAVVGVKTTFLRPPSPPSPPLISPEPMPPPHTPPSSPPSPPPPLPPPPPGFRFSFVPEITCDTYAVTVQGCNYKGCYKKALNGFSPVCWSIPTYCMHTSGAMNENFCNVERNDICSWNATANACFPDYNLVDSITSSFYPTS